MKLNNFKIPNKVKFIMNTLKEKGFEVYLVGGSVRDILLNKTPDDYDLTTNASILDIKDAFKNYNFVNDNGFKHDTVSINLDGEIFEITTFRNNSKTIYEDLKYRDLSINAIAFDGLKLYHLEHSINDLNNKKIRLNNNPDERIMEDSLRILRVLRFSATLDFSIENETKMAILKLKSHLNKCSMERIREEFNKIILSDNAFEIIKKYKEIFSIFIPELEPTFGFEQKNKYHIHDVFEHNLYVMKGVKNDLETRLAAFFHDIGKPNSVSKELVNGKEIYHFYKHPIESERLVFDILKRLKYSNSTIENVKFLVRFHDFKVTNSRKNLKKLLSLMGEKYVELFPKFIDLVASDRADHINLNEDNYIDYRGQITSLYESITSSSECFSLKDLNLNGRDLLDLGIPQGPIYKVILQTLLEAVINGYVSNDKTSLSSLALNTYEEAK